MGDHIEDAVDDMRDDIEDAGGNIEDAVEDMIDAMGDAVGGVGDDAEDVVMVARTSWGMIWMMIWRRCRNCRN